MDRSNKLKAHKLLSLLTLVVGILVLIYAITVEDEPTLVAPLLVVFGAAWYFITRARTRTHNKRH